MAKAIYEEMDLSDSLALPEATRYARAAIEAYEAALINAAMNTATGIKIMEDQERPNVFDEQRIKLWEPRKPRLNPYERDEP